MANNSTTATNNRETQRLLILSAFVDGALGLMKVFVGLYAASHALIADGIHSLSDLATDLMVWIFNRVGVQAPDEDHPYGHARFETFGTMILGVLLIGVAALIVYDSIERLMVVEDIETPGWLALVGAGASIAVKEWLYWITKRLGERIRSKLLVANAWHHRTDSFSSVIVLVGVGGAMLGIPWLEMVASVGVALIIAHIGWRLTKQSVEELVDTAMSKSYVREIQRETEGAEGVRGVHSLRTRRMGSDVFLDIHLQVDPAVSVSEGHHIGEWVTRSLLEKFRDLADVTVHIDAEDDEEMEEREEPLPNIPPPGKHVRTQLIRAWHSLLSPDEIRKMTLHYLNNSVSVEVFLERRKLQEPGHDPEALKAELLEKAHGLHWLRRVTVWYG
ncbi:MAG: cation transporter [Pseudomonadales bacterium]|nr:cation transporter [Pseudomonadales bacterium]